MSRPCLSRHRLRGATGSDALPTRDELTLAWGDRVLGGLRPKVKMLFAAGRFLDDREGQAAFALPNATHVQRCEPLRADVEAALAAEFGRPVPLILVVDGGVDSPPAPAPTSRGEPDDRPTEGSPAPTPVVDELADIGPVDDLEDAGSASTGLDQVTEVFGKVELIEEEPDD